MLLLIALALLVQDPPPGEVISTAPPPAPTASMADPFAAPARPAQAPGFHDLFPEVVQPAPLTAPPSSVSTNPWTGISAGGPQVGYARSGAGRVGPLPARAYEDPIRYSAEACRAESRPADEDMRACYARIESTVAASRPAAPPPRPRVQAPPRVRCEQRQTRDDDGRTSSTSAHCTTGTGDTALLDDLLGWD